MSEKKRAGGNITDARGRAVSQIDPVKWQLLHRYDAIEADVLDEIVEALEPGTAKWRRHMIVIVPVAICIVVVGFVALYWAGDASLRADLVSTLTNPALMIPTVVGCFIIPWVAARENRFRRIRLAMLKYNRCPHCGYDLRGLPVSTEDHATVCPECGSAWHIDVEFIEEQLTAALVQQRQVSGRARWVGAALVFLLLLGNLLGIIVFMRI